MPTETEEQIVAAAQRLRGQGVASVLVKLGSRGSLLVGEHCAAGCLHLVLVHAMGMAEGWSGGWVRAAACWWIKGSVQHGMHGMAWHTMSIVHAAACGRQLRSCLDALHGRRGLCSWCTTLACWQAALISDVSSSVHYYLQMHERACR